MEAGSGVPSGRMGIPWRDRVESDDSKGVARGDTLAEDPVDREFQKRWEECDVCTAEAGPVG